MLSRFKDWLESLKHQPASDADIEIPPGCFIIPAVAFMLALMTIVVLIYNWTLGAKMAWRG